MHYSVVLYLIFNFTWNWITMGWMTFLMSNLFIETIISQTYVDPNIKRKFETMFLCAVKAVAFHLISNSKCDFFVIKRSDKFCKFLIENDGIFQLFECQNKENLKIVNPLMLVIGSLSLLIV